MFIGLLILAIGVIFLLRNTGVIQEKFGDIFWPVILIALGISIVVGKRRKN